MNWSGKVMHLSHFYHKGNKQNSLWMRKRDDCIWNLSSPASKSSKSFENCFTSIETVINKFDHIQFLLKCNMIIKPCCVWIHLSSDRHIQPPEEANQTKVESNCQTANSLGSCCFPSLHLFILLSYEESWASVEVWRHIHQKVSTFPI